jgi:hypothetical protein
MQRAGAASNRHRRAICQASSNISSGGRERHRDLVAATPVSPLSRLTSAFSSGDARKLAHVMQDRRRAHLRARKPASRSIAMNTTVIIKDLPPPAEHELDEITLTPEQMKRRAGGQRAAVTVDGTRPGTVDDLDINTAIFEGRIKGSYL